MLICKEREDYFNVLKNTTKNTTNNNTTNNNTTNNNITNNNITNNITNNVTIFSYGQENNEDIIKELQRIGKLANNESSDLMIAGNYIVRYKELLNSRPENRNIIVSERSAFGKVRIGDKWKKITKHRLIGSSFKKSAKSLTDQIGLSGMSYNTDKIEEFADSGLEHPDLSYQQRCRLTNDYSIQLNAIE